MGWMYVSKSRQMAAAFIRLSSVDGRKEDPLPSNLSQAGRGAGSTSRAKDVRVCVFGVLKCVLLRLWLCCVCPYLFVFVAVLSLVFRAVWTFVFVRLFLCV